MIRPTRAIEAIPATTPFIGPEQLMRETGRRALVRLGANESAFGPSPKAVAAMTRELTRLSWYGDPESFDLRDALAEKHACLPEQIVVGSGIDDLMGLAVRAFVAPDDAALATRGTYPTFAYHVAGYGGRLIGRLVRKRRYPGSRRVDGGGAARTTLDRLFGESRQSERPLHRARRDNELLRCAAARQPLAARRGICRFRRRQRTVRATLRRPAHSIANVLQGVRNGGRPHRLRPFHRAQRARRFRRFDCTTALTATRRSARWHRWTTTSFGGTWSRKRRARGRSTNRLARALGPRKHRISDELRLH